MGHFVRLDIEYKGQLQHHQGHCLYPRSEMKHLQEGAHGTKVSHRIITRPQYILKLLLPVYARRAPHVVVLCRLLRLLDRDDHCLLLSLGADGLLVHIDTLDFTLELFMH